MTPLIVLVVAFLVFLLLGRAGVPPLRDGGVTPLRWALAAMFLLTASAHWGAMRPDLVRMVPPGLPDPELLVTLTGVAEIAGALGLLVPRLAPLVFTESIGIPLRPYLAWLRVQRAAGAIASNVPLGDAAHAAGFSDAAHMTRTFRRMLGATPSALRRGSPR